MTTTTMPPPPPASPRIDAVIERWRGCWHSQHHLAVVHGPDAGWTVPLEAGTRVVVGRGDGADLRLADPLLRAEHAILTMTSTGLRLAPRAGPGTRLLRAGTRGRPLERRRARRPWRGRVLRPGDALRLGGTTLVLRPSPHQAAAAVPRQAPGGRPAGRWRLVAVVAPVVVVVVVLGVLIARGAPAYLALGGLGMLISAAVALRSWRENDREARSRRRRPLAASRGSSLRDSSGRAPDAGAVDFRAERASPDVEPDRSGDPAAFAVRLIGAAGRPIDTDPVLLDSGLLSGELIASPEGGIAVVGDEPAGLTRWCEAQLAVASAAPPPVRSATRLADLAPGPWQVLTTAGRLGVSALWREAIDHLARPSGAEVLLTSLLGDPGPDEVAEAWAARSTSLAVPLGSGGAASLDLARDGPHALVAGTTGSGKSELLQTWVLALASRHAPADLAVLLVDYKGGATFPVAAGLPHCVGLLTDLDPAGSRRALSALRHELRRRERVLAAAGARDREQLVAAGGRMGRLVVVVDELRALVEDDEQRLADLVAIATLGRSLGVHLVLATQRPAGVVTGQLRANLTLRLCLRVLDAGDSQDVIGSSAAQRLTEPGTALIAGSGTVCRIAWLPERSAQDLAAVIDLAAERLRRRRRLDLLATHRPWLPPLPAVVTEAEVASGAGTGAGTGGAGTGAARPMLLLDRPDRLRHEPWAWTGGRLLVSGPSRSGRSQALQAAVRGHPGGIAHVLSREGWGEPSAGTVLAPEHADVMARLLARLGAGEDDDALVVLDDVEHLVAALDEATRPGTGLDLVTSLVTRRRAGSVAIGSSSLHRWAASADVHLALGVRDRGSAALLDVPSHLVDAGAPPGRGVLRQGPECLLAQVLLPGPDDPVPAGGPFAPVTAGRRGLRLRPLPDHLELPVRTPLAASRLGSEHRGAGDLDSPVIGLGGDDAAPVALPLRPGQPVVVVGPHGSGRSTTLDLIAALLAGDGLGAGTDPAAGTDSAAGTGTRVLRFDPRTHRPPEAIDPDAVVLVDDVERCPDSATPELTELLTRRCVVTTTPQAWQTGYRGVLPLLREARIVLALGGYAPVESAMARPLRSPPGRALLVVDGRAIGVQLARPP